MVGPSVESGVDPTRTSSDLTAERREPARIGHSLGLRSRSACRSENGRSDNAPQTADFDPSPTSH